jgi:hypothetical protein
MKSNGRGASEDLVYTKALSWLEDALLARRMELAQGILDMYGLPLPPESQ